MRRHSVRAHRVTGTLLGLSLVLIQTAGFASANPAVSMPKVAGATTFKVKSGAAWGSIRLNRPTQVSLQWTRELAGLRGVKFPTSDRMQVLVLVPQGKLSPSVQAVALPPAEKRAAEVVALGRNLCERCDLAAGSYDVFVLGGSSRGITVFFEGLDGTTTIELNHKARGGLKDADDEFSLGTPYLISGIDSYGAGYFVDVDSRNTLLFHALWYRGADEPPVPGAPVDEPLASIGHSADCLYRDNPPPGMGFAPGCPGGQSGFGLTSAWMLQKKRYLRWGARLGSQPGTYGIGAWAIHTGIFDPGFAGFWLELQG